MQSENPLLHAKQHNHPRHVQDEEPPAFNEGIYPLQAEDQQLLDSFNNTTADYPAHQTLMDLFEEQAADVPDAPAIIAGNRVISYRELDEQANSLAHYLRGTGVPENAMVAVCTDRTPHMLIAILGILKAGAVYVPLDPAYPEERMDFIAKDIQAAAVVTTRQSAQQLNGISDVPLIFVEEITAGGNTGPIKRSIRPASPAYVIYTSGSTGQPKGVVGLHTAVVNMIFSLSRTFDISRDERILLMAAYNFDASIEQLFFALLNGAALVLIDTDTILDAASFERFLKEQRISHLESSPVFLEQLTPGSYGGLKRVISGGEQCKRELAGKWAPHVKFYNLYGPTETTVTATCFYYHPDISLTSAALPIGKPLANVTVHILSAAGAPMPVGAAGEICIGGTGVTGGYLNRQELTDRKFVSYPDISGNGKIYHTGDKGRWLPDGTLEYLGRMDSQVKIRGFRVEPGETEHVLLSLPEINSGAVVVKEDEHGQPQLTAFFVPRPEVVSEKAALLAQQQIARWQELYQTAYTASLAQLPEDETFNTYGWNDSFTDAPIPAAAMLEWQQDIVSLILGYAPQQVLEIGCGNGLIYERLAPHIRRYTGTDFSAVSIQQLTDRIRKKTGSYPDTTLFAGAAHEVTLPENETTDTIILNSVIQYFPGEPYLLQVLDRCFSLLKGAGRIIIGDVRDLRLLHAFKSRLLLRKTPDKTILKDFIWEVNQEVMREEELCISPVFFYQLKDRYPEIEHIDISWKQGDHENELTLYRYTVILHISRQEEVIQPAWQSWYDVSDIPALFHDTPPLIALSGLPNPRLWREQLLKTLLKTDSITTTGELTTLLTAPGSERHTILQLLQTAREAGYEARYLVAEDPLQLDLLLTRGPLNAFVAPAAVWHSSHEEAVVNTPLFPDICQLLQSDIRARLQEHLPAYMLPLIFIGLDKLPLNINGKIDRRFLTESPAFAVRGSAAYEAPRNMAEAAMTEIWQEVLGIPRIGVHDNFFDLGGHSLLAMRLLTAIRKTSAQTISVKELFAHPDIAALVNWLQNRTADEVLPSLQAMSAANVPLPLSAGQQRLWFIHQLQGSEQYQEPLVFRINGPLHAATLEHALKLLLKRHEVLRTVVRPLGEGQTQVILDQNGWKLEHTTTTAALFRQELELWALLPFNLSQDFMLRARLIHLHGNTYVLALLIHHIAADGWTIALLMKELTALYHAVADGTAHELTPPAWQFADYAIWQQTLLESGQLAAKTAWWKQQLQDVSPLELPADFERPAMQSTRGTSEVFRINKTLLQRLHALSRKEGSTLFMTMLAAFKVLLYRYTGQEDLCVGTATAGRFPQETEQLAGFFVNMLALRSSLDDHLPFNTLLQQVKETTLSAFEHQEVPFEKVVEAVVRERDISRNPIFQVVFVLQNMPAIPALRLGEAIGIREHFPKHTSQFDLNWLLEEKGDELEITVEYCADLFTRERIVRMTAHYEQLLRAVVADPAQQTGRLQLLTPAEECVFLQHFAGSGVTGYPEDKTILDLFEAQVALYPDKVAVTDDTVQLTYSQLDEQAARLGQYLHSNGVQPETLVPVCMERGGNMIIGILGILKAGGAYVPIDPQYPADRIQYILEDTAAMLVVCDSTGSIACGAVASTATVIDIDNLQETISRLPAISPDIIRHPAHLAYVIYTSGSTGRPKGVLIEHRNVVRLFMNDQPCYDFSGQDVWTMFHSFCFDFSVWEMYGALFYGGRLVIVPRTVAQDSIAFAHLLVREKVTVLNQTPSAFYVLQDYLTAQVKDTVIRYVIFGGEALHPVKVRPWKLQYPSCRMINMYGITETTVHVTFQELDARHLENNASIIGKTIPTLRACILNASRSPVPLGVPGELYIGGAGLARGYLNLPELTAEKFITDRFTPDGRLYKTGDRARWLPDGSIEYLGRVDEQVKIRGYRIEPGEIENTLLKSGLVSQSVVLAKTDPAGGKQLIGYIVAKDRNTPETVHTWLKAHLPAYMVPDIWITLEYIPLTTNGKINRKALPDPDLIALAAEDYTAPRNETEETLAEVWQALLQVEQAGIHQNFFRMGGHSLLATRMVSVIRNRLGKELQVKDFFNHPTIARLAAHLQTLGETSLLPPVTAISKPVNVPLSFGQERLWFIDRLQGSIQYHISDVFRLSGTLNRSAMETALRTIVERHEALRTVIREENGRPYQELLTADSWKMGYSVTETDVETIIARPFDLTADHLLRAHLITLAPEDHLLVLVIHHIAADGWSLSVLLKEWMLRYQAAISGDGAVPEPLPLQYAHYALWQRQYLDDAFLHKKLAYWKKQLGDVPVLKVPADFQRPAVQSNNGAMIKYEINRSLTTRLKTFSDEQGVTLFMTMLAAFKVMLFRYSGQEDLCVGSGVAGRLQQETENMIGFFVNALPLRSHLGGNPRFTDLLQQIRHTTLAAYEHQEVPFEKIVEAVLDDRDVNKNPLFQVVFVVQNLPEVPDFNLGGLTLSKYDFKHTTSLLDLSFAVTEHPDGLHIETEYATDLFRADTVRKLQQHYEILLTAILEHPAEKISRLKLLLPEEETLLLSGFRENIRPYPRDKTLQDILKQWVERSPDATAIIFRDENVTYLELDERSSRLAHYLRAQGVENGAMVAISMERSAGMIIGMWGILKAGAAYVPVDPGYPEERIGYILEDTGATVLLTGSQLKEQWRERDGVRVLAPDIADLAIYPVITPDLPDFTAYDLAYVIYTSGSTGKPKGVMVQHNSVVNMALGEGELLGLKPGTRSLQFSSFTFDASCFDIFNTLLSGGCLVIPEKEVLLSPEHFTALIKTHNVSLLACPPSYLQVMKEHLGMVSTVVSGGEPLNSDLAQDIQEKGIRLVNSYGPTESTVCVTFTDNPLQPDGSVVIGKPVPNVRLYILDAYGGLVPPGGTGELCICGIQVARGYLNLPDLTTERFVRDPFSENPQERMYRTGDLARRLPDGNIEYQGRIDEQVKIRGHRIEPGETEHVLNTLPEVAGAAVVVEQDNMGSNRMVCYYMPAAAAVRKEELSLQAQQVDTWKALYDAEYAQLEVQPVVQEEFNIGGWNDSFTGGPIPATEMEAWLEDIVSVILAQQPSRVLEIGCGSGLVYYRLVPHISRYIGTDFSATSIEQIRRHISRGDKQYPESSFMACAAHEVVLAPEENIDTILLNSIVQYFPGEQYLDEVIDKSSGLLKGKGRIILGDVRDLRLLPAFKQRLSLDRLPEKTNLRTFDWYVGQEVLKEEELCVSPEYFYRLAATRPDITHVDIRWKQGDFCNELSLYRYTVVLHIGEKKNLLEPRWATWDYQAAVKAIAAGEEITAWKGVPNFRLWKEQRVSEGLKQPAVLTTGDLQRYITGSNGTDNIPVLLKEAVAAGYHPYYFVGAHPLQLDLLLLKTPLTAWCARPAGVREKGTNTNVPTLMHITALLQQTIRRKLAERLPEYMIPADFIALQHLPVTSHGKTDRRFLSDIRQLHERSSLGHETPATPAEQQLAAIWEELLGIARIGRHDNFFELGGHSLLATRAVAVIRDHLRKVLTVKDFFNYPTIAQQAAWLEEQETVTALPPLTREDRPARVPLSFGQERLWFIDRLQGSIQYHMPAIIRLSGKVDTAALTYALQQIINRHEVLRTVIKDDAGHAYQELLEKDNWQLLQHDLTATGEAEQWQKLIEPLVRIPFDLTADHLLRAHLLRLDAEEHVLLITVHHIAFDGWSTALLIKELTALYGAYITQQPAVLPPLPVQYADFAIWQRKNLHEEGISVSLDYWQQQLRDVPPLGLPTDYLRPPVRSIRGSKVYLKIDKALTAQLYALSQQQGVTLYMTLLAAFKVLLYRYSGQEDICVGSAVAGRLQRETEPLLGFFLNSIALRSDLGGNPAFIDLLQQVKTTTLAAYEHQAVPFEKVVETVVQQRDMSRAPLFQVLFILQNIPKMEALRLGDTVLSYEDIPPGTSLFDIGVSIIDMNGVLEIETEYCTDLFMPATITRLMQHYHTLLRAIAVAPATEISYLPLMDAATQEKLLSTFRSVRNDLPRDQTLATLFAGQAARTPDSKALIFRDQSLTYRELDEQSSALAVYLQSQGVTAGTLVPVCVERSLVMIIGAFAAMKAGAAYVPIDPDYPHDRIRYMVEDTGAQLLLGSAAVMDRLPEDTGAVILDMDRLDELLTGIAADAPLSGPQATDLAYVIYTSGSTGRPKGVMVQHNSIVNLALGIIHVAELRPGSKVLQFSSFSFDVSCSEIFCTLLSGGTLVIPEKKVLLVPEAVEALIIQHHITVAMLPPTYQQLIRDHTGTIHTIVSAGEVLSSELAMYLLDKDIRLINAYGPTETTVYDTYSTAPMLPDGRVVIGGPLPNVQLYILNEYRGLVPLGGVGEVYIGGIQVARGYLNRQTLTAEKFLTDPFYGDGHERMYRTGDKARWLQGGNLEFVGRTDEQVKIRGFRIEPGEVEEVMLQCGFVSQAAVTARKNSEGAHIALIGYVVPNGKFRKEEIMEYLRKRLPEYMVPGLLIEMEELPVTPNGKTDRRSLPDPGTALWEDNSYAAPRNELEGALTAIWEQLLETSPISITDNFFEKGGHSLLAARVAAAIRSTLAKEITVKDLFSAPTIEELAALLEQQDDTALPPLEPQLRPENIPLSFSQELVWELDRTVGTASYNMPVVFRLYGRPDKSALEAAFKAIVERHETLRTIIRETDGMPYQHILPPGSWQISAVPADYEANRGTPAALKSFLGTLVRIPFDLSSDHMLRVHLLPLQNEEHLLVINVHHIAYDGWSVAVLMRELTTFYNAFTGQQEILPAPLPVQYADYTLWQRKHLEGRMLETRLGYWRQQLHDPVLLEIPYDNERPARLRMTGAGLSMILEKELGDQLKLLSVQQGVTPAMTMLAAYKIVLARYSGQEDICIGSAVAGRSQQATEGMIGFFLNIIALRTSLAGDPSFETLLQRVKTTTLGAYQHQEVPFEKVKAAVAPQGQPLFRMNMIMQNFPKAPALHLGNLKLQPEPFAYITSSNDIGVAILDFQDHMELKTEYSTEVFKEATIVRLLGDYKTVLQQIVQTPGIPISALQLMDADTARQWLAGVDNTDNKKGFISRV